MSQQLGHLFLYTTKLNTCGRLVFGWQFPEAPMFNCKRHPARRGCSGMASSSTWFSRDLPLPRLALTWVKPGCYCSLWPSGQGPSCPLDPLPLLGQPSSGIPASRSSLGEKGRELAKLAAWLLLHSPGERGN